VIESPLGVPSLPTVTPQTCPEPGIETWLEKIVTRTDRPLRANVPDALTTASVSVENV
jgi:hypothetical protein